MHANLYRNPIPLGYRSHNVQEVLRKEQFSQAERLEVMQAFRISYPEGCVAIDRVRLRHMTETDHKKGGDLQSKAKAA